MRIDLALTCDYALIDQYGKLSVMGIFDRIWIARFPAVHPRLHLVLRLKGKRTEIGKHSVTIRLVDDSGNQILAGDGNVDFAEPPAGVTDIEAGTVLVFDVPFARPGRYEFQITLDGEEHASVPLLIGQLPSAGSPPEPGPGSGGGPGAGTPN
jgi:Family of unknown function (DUF6941)